MRSCPRVHQHVRWRRISQARDNNKGSGICGRLAAKADSTPKLQNRVLLEDVINEYSRPARIIENGKEKLVDALSGRGFLNFPGVGRLEYFITDGLGSLPRSFPKVHEMYEYTLRYPGHAEMMNTLRVLGFFDRREVQVNGVAITPRKLFIALLKGAMSMGRPEDLLALRVEVEGALGKKTLINYAM